MRFDQIKCVWVRMLLYDFFKYLYPSFNFSNDSEMFSSSFSWTLLKLHTSCFKHVYFFFESFKFNMEDLPFPLWFAIWGLGPADITKTFRRTENVFGKFLGLWKFCVSLNTVLLLLAVAVGPLSYLMSKERHNKPSNRMMTML